LSTRHLQNWAAMLALWMLASGFFSLAALLGW